MAQTLVRASTRAAISVLISLVGATGLNASTIYLLGGYYPLKSIDDGASWQPVAITINTNLLSGAPTIVGLTFNPANPTTLYATANFNAASAFLSSSDSGNSWTATPQTSFQFKGGAASNSGQVGAPGGLATDCSNPKFLYAMAETTMGPAIVRSENSGATWTVTTLPNTPEYPASNTPGGSPVASFTVDPEISGLVYAVAGHYIFNSVDYGASWSVLSTGILKADSTNANGGTVMGGPELTQLSIDPTNSKTIFASLSAGTSVQGCPQTGGGACGVWKSSDTGITWQDLSLPAPNVGPLAFSSGAIYAGADLTGLGPSVVKTIDGGNTWTPLKNGFTYPRPIVETDPNSPNVFASGNYDLWRSSDGGNSWVSLTVPVDCSDNETCSIRPFIYNLVFVPLAPTIAVPSIASSGVVNGANFQPGIAANSWATISGTSLALGTDNWNNSLTSGTFPTTLDGVTVSVGGQAAYVYFISPMQINVLVPNVPSGPANVTVTNAAGTSAAISVMVSEFSPAFFLWPENQAVATHTDFTLAAQSGTFSGTNTVPAKPGETIILWGTGFGPTSPTAPSGVPTPSNAVYSTNSLPQVTLNGMNATVSGAALAPGFGGLYQIAIQVPPGIASRAYQLETSIGGVQSVSTAILNVSN